MPIDIIFNGYYRSGTTYFWEKLKSEYPAHSTFYEPLNSKLPTYIKQYESSSGKDRLHHKKLWGEYLLLSPFQRHQMLLKQPKFFLANSFNKDSLFEYLDFFHRLDMPVILQTNRLHCFLDLVGRRYGAKIIHIIRHPLDVMNSMKTSYLDLGITGLHRRVLKKILRDLILHKYFSIEDEFNWIKSHLGYPVELNEMLWLRFNPFACRQKIITNWVVFNYMALQLIEKAGGIVIFYELIGRSNKMNEALMDYLDIDSLKFSDFSTKKIFNFKDTDLDQYKTDINRLGLKDEWAFIKKSALKYGIDYENSDLI